MNYIKSIFEQPTPNFKLWNSSSSLKCDPKSQISVFQGKIWKKSKQTKTLAQRFFTLTRTHIFYSKTSKDSNIRGVINLERVRVHFISPCEEREQGQNDTPANQKGIFTIRIIKNGKFSDLFFKQQQIFEAWKEAFIPLTIQIDFYDKFSIIKMIGKGSFAKVYEAETKDGKRFAVKAFNKEFLQQKKRGPQSILNELRILRKLDHPNCLKFYEIHETISSVFLVTELIKNGNFLKSKKQGLKNKEIKLIMKKILQALTYLSSQNIMHRDIKPDNIMINVEESDPDRQFVKLIDFGLANSSNFNHFLFTKCGTPGFLAPEVFQSTKKKKYDSKCDVFSAGVVFYFMLTGTVPFEGKDMNKVIEKNSCGFIDFTQESLKELHPFQLSLLQRMLIVNPRQRPTAKECLNHELFIDEISQFNSKSFFSEESIVQLQSKYKLSLSSTKPWNKFKQQSIKSGPTASSSIKLGFFEHRCVNDRENDCDLLETPMNDLNPHQLIKKYTFTNSVFLSKSQKSPGKTASIFTALSTKATSPSKSKISRFIAHKNRKSA